MNLPHSPKAATLRPGDAFWGCEVEGADVTWERDRYDYQSRALAQRMADELRGRRRAALKAASKVSVQITRDGRSVSELIFDTPPTLAQLVERAGADAFVLAIGRHWVAPRDRPEPGGAGRTE